VIDLVSPSANVVAGLDDLACLAARLCDAEFAAISTGCGVAQHVVVVTGRGVEPDGALPAAVHRAAAQWCTLVADNSRGQVVTSTGEQLDRDVAVSEPWRVQSAAGVRLCTTTGRHTTVVLCVFDGGQRSWSAMHGAALEMLARQVALLVVNSEHDVRASNDVATPRRHLTPHRGVAPLDALPLGVAIVSGTGQVEYVNAHAGELLLADGNAPDELLRTGLWFGVVDADGRPVNQLTDPVASVLASGVARLGVQMSVLHPGSLRRRLRVDVVPLGSIAAENVGVLVTIVDVTREAVAELGLRQSFADLEAFLTERSALVTAIAHDLRAPVAAIRIRSELMETRAADLGEELVASMIRQIALDAAAAQHTLDGLIDPQVNDWSIDGPRRARVDLDDCIARALAFEHTTTHTLVAVDSAACSRHVLADPGLMDRCIHNLVSNAVRHTPVGTTIEIGVIETPAELVLFVDDDGPGLAPELWSEVFQPYYRAPEAAGRPGSGLGLYLVQLFATFHAGSAAYEPSPRGGARFTISLPRFA
jgi:signal transduction histidine kinase